MLSINVICVGKLKEEYWVDAVKEYSKRISRYAAVTITELKEERLAENASQADEDAVKAAEGKSIIKKIRDSSFVIALDVKGTQLSSERLAEKINATGLSGVSSIDFIIGGSLGLSEEVLRRSDFRLSFSAMTFPHQMMRVILLEQIYRAFKIIKNEPYHK